MKAEVHVLRMRTNGYGETCRNGEKLPCFVSECAMWERANLAPDTDYACLMVRVPDGWEIEPEPTGKRGLRMYQGSIWDTPLRPEADGSAKCYIRRKQPDAHALAAELESARKDVRECKVLLESAQTKLAELQGRVSK